MFPPGIQNTLADHPGTLVLRASPSHAPPRPLLGLGPALLTLARRASSTGFPGFPLPGHGSHWSRPFPSCGSLPIFPSGASVPCRSGLHVCSPGLPAALRRGHEYVGAPGFLPGARPRCAGRTRVCWSLNAHLLGITRDALATPLQAPTSALLN